MSPEWNEASWQSRPHPTMMIPGLKNLFSMFVGDLTGQRVLELGCGDGVNCSAILASGGEFYGVDGDAQAIAKAKEKCPDGHFAITDFTEWQPFGGDFDVVFDRASISHNTIEGIRGAVKVIRDSLKSGGLFLGSDWFSVRHSEFEYGQRIETRTHRDYPDGQFRGIGNVHFTQESEIAELFSGFQAVRIHERIEKRYWTGVICNWESQRFNFMPYVSAVFDFIMRKP